MSWQFLVSLFLGASLGSFLNVVSLRFGKKGGISGRSHCPHCGHVLRWWELIPVLSFMLLRARCFACHRPLSWQYPLVEILSAAVWGWAFWNLPSSSQDYIVAAAVAVIGTLLILLWIVDLKYFLLPDYYLVLLTLAVVIRLSVAGGPTATSALQGAAFGAGSLLLIWAATQGKGLGFGDVKLAIPLGLLFGFSGMATLLFLAFLSGGLTATLLLISQRATLKTAVPFGPYLLAAAFVLLLDPHLPARLFASLL